MEISSDNSLRGRAVERIAFGIIAPLLIALCIFCLSAVDSIFGSPSELSGHIGLLAGRALWIEVFGAFVFFLVVGFVWAIFRPAWSARVLLWARDHVWHGLLLALFGFVIICYVT